MHTISIIGLAFVCSDTLDEGTYSLIINNDLKYTMHKKSIIFKDMDAILLIIRAFNAVENLQRKMTEEKFRSVLLSTVTHDIKTPLTVIKSNIALLQDHVCEGGKAFYNATCIATDVLEHYLRDIIVTIIRVILQSRT